MEVATAPAPAEQSIEQEFEPLSATGKKISPADARRKAMSDPVRRAVLRDYVEHGPKAPVEVGNDLGIELSKVSYHTRVLKKLGCLELVAERPVRGSVKHFYVATERHLVSQAEFEGLPETERKGVVADAFQPMIDDVTSAVAAGTLGKDGDFHITRIPVRAMDAEGYSELRAAYMRLYEETSEISKRAGLRMAESGEESFPVSAGLTCFVVDKF